ncbi:unnamed protein product [Cuscuta epithymum]|uniref:Copia protein n=1 Tax=Cuscuta epithymum TaxID=186058 RepID=A0AAV0EB09_9ASTE|nr:unnamed protein product [Cuscuta epithymum]
MPGCLRFMCHSRPEIMFGVGMVSRFMQEPRHSHLVAAKRILRYLKGTSRCQILFASNVHASSQDSELELVAYIDSDWCGDKVDRRSTMRYVFFLENVPVSWCSSKQDVVALSTCEIEYIAACHTSCQGLWLLSLLKELNQVHNSGLELYVDNKSAINLAKNPITHLRSKHIETRFHFLRDQVNKGRVQLIHCSTTEQVADVFTKALKTESFQKFKEMLRVVSL